MKKIISSALIITSLLTLAGCRDSTPSQTIPPTQSTQTGIPHTTYVPDTTSATLTTPSDNNDMKTQIPDVVPPTIVINEHYVNILPETEITSPYSYHNILGDTEYVSNNITNGVNACGDDEFYFLEYDENGYVTGVSKFDLKTSEVVSACTDPGCVHGESDGCIGITFPDQETAINTSNKNSLQYASRDALYFSVNGCVYRYNNESSKTEKLTFYDGVVNSYNYVTAFSYGDYIYTQQYILKKGTDPMKFDNYVFGIFKTHKNGKTTELVKDLGTKSTSLYYITNDKMYFLKNDFTVISTDLNGENEKVELDVFWLWDFCVKGDKIIYSVISELSEFRGFKACNIYCLDTKTGETKKLSDERVLYYYVTGKYIYFIPRPDGNNYWRLMRMNHDGTDAAEVMKITNLDTTTSLSGGFYIFGDYMITRVLSLNNNVGYHSYICYDLTNSSYTNFGSGKWYKMNYEELTEE